MLMPPTVLPALALPAWSVAGSLVTLWLAPSPLTSLLVGQDATPDRLSVQVKSTTTLSLYQPAPFGWAVGPTSVGLVLSMLTGPKSVPLVLPATSIASPWTFWPAPSLV